MPSDTSPVSVCIISFTGSSDLADILELLNDVTNSHFKMLGLQLGLLLPTLEQIEQACSPEEFGMKVLHTWLEQKDQVMEKGEPTFSQLIKALQTRTVELNDRVQRIQDWLKQK